LDAILRSLFDGPSIIERGAPVKRRDFIAGLAASPSLAAAAREQGQAQSQTPARPPAPLTVTLLGTGTPAPSLDRQSSGYLIAAGRDLIVWDHGPGAHQRLIESGHRPIDVTHAFFTHLHYDHCMDYGRLVLQRWDQGAGRIGELKVYGPPPLARMTEQLFGADGVYGPDIRARVEHRSSLDVYEARGGTLPRARPAPRVTEIHAGSVVEGDGWKLTAGHAQHVQPYLECLAFRLDTAEGSVCYTGDSGPSDTIVELAKGCDLLIHMNHYFSGTEPSPAYRAACGNHRDNATIAKRAGVKTLVLTHLLAQIDRPAIREQIVHEIRQVFDGAVIWGEDLMRLTVRPTGIESIETRASVTNPSRD
jgi:ribonuclease Z